LAGRAISLERLIVSGAVNLVGGECHKRLTVGGNIDHIHRGDLYSAARSSRRNGFYRATQLC